MIGDVLRRAARLMRERAEAATPGPWRDFTYGDPMMHYVDAGPNTNLVASGAFWENADAAHIASWHPAVALAVADWLDLVARAVDAAGGMKAATLATQANAYAALDVARKYLGADQ
jgi:hypothetical protein